MSDEYENERLVFFSDAVIAITITLMVLEVRLPVSAEDLSDGQLWEALKEIWPRYFSYMLSFLVIGTFWAGHLRKFKLIIRSSPRLIWLNMLFLMAIGLMPFVTDVLAENGGKVSTVLYAALVAVISLVSAVISAYAASAGLTDGSYSTWKMALPSLATAFVFGLSIIIALFSPDAGKYFWLALIPANLLVGRILGNPAVR